MDKKKSKKPKDAPVQQKQENQEQDEDNQSSESAASDSQKDAEQQSSQKSSNQLVILGGDENGEDEQIDEEGEAEFEEQNDEEGEMEMEEEVGSSEEDEEMLSLQKLHPEIPTHYMERQKWTRLIVILEKANLQTYKTPRGIELLNCDDHQKIIQKMGRKYEDFRPDVTHQCMLTLFDSPLCKAGLLQVFIRTEEGILIEINPHLRVPRSFKLFSAFIAQLLSKLKVRSDNGSATLATVIKNPITDYLPMGVKCVGTSKLGQLVSLNQYVKDLDLKKKPLVFVIGAVSVGNPGMDNDLGLEQENISISKHGLSAACVCGKVCNAMEKLWNVV